MQRSVGRGIGADTAEVLVGQRGSLAATRGTHEIALLYEVRLVDLLDGARVLADSGGDGSEADGAATKLVDDGGKDADVHLVEAAGVDIERGESIAGDVEGDSTVALDLSEIADTAEETVGDARGATAASRNLDGRLGSDFDTEERGRTVDDRGEGVGVVILEAAVDTEARTEWCGKHTRASSGADERKGLEVDLYRTGGRAGLYHDIDTIVLHSGIEILLDDGRETVNLVDEKDIVFGEAGKETGEVAGFVEDRSRGHLKVDAQLVGDDVREGCLAEARRAVEEHMVERFGAVGGGTDKDA